MKGFSLEQFMLRAWYGQQRWLVLLRPLSSLYSYVVTRRRRRYLADASRVWQSPVPLIVVGNITLGGTGKTPMCIWLIDYFRNQGLRPGLISRGYGAVPPSTPWLIDPARDNPFQAGDEPLLIASRCGVPVVIDPDRPRAARHLLASAEVDVIISDDGLQHYALGRDLEILMVDAVRELGNRRCLPEGPLREPVSRAKAVDFFVRNGAPADSELGFGMILEPVALVNLCSGERIAPQDWEGSRLANAVAGIGNPERFFNTLERLSFQLKRHAYTDHAEYHADSFAACDPHKPLIMTEKDAIKCASFARSNWWYLSIEASLSDAFIVALQSRLDRVCLREI
ncbi:MAG: tetraacyldisaccharide 4'-kinase [Halopseudomonas sp.]